MSKRLKHKFKFKPPETVLCQKCKVTDVTNSDPESEYVCKKCWDLFSIEQKKIYKINKKTRCR